jgi:outer membrane protein TolC
VAGDPIQQAQVGLTVIQRLLRGAGSVGAASAIDSARLAQRAAEHAVAQSAQIQALSTILAYWDLVAATENLTLLRAATEQAERLVGDTTQLVEGNQRPRSDLRQLEANLATRKRDVLDAENSLEQARFQIQEIMGLGADTRPSFRPVDGFPAPHSFAEDTQALTRTATEKRNDVKAARRLVGSTAAQLRGDEFNTKPALDLSASVGYAGALDEDGVDAFFLSTGNNVEGVNASIGLSFELPFNNTTQGARRDLSRARYDQARIAAANL